MEKGETGETEKWQKLEDCDVAAKFVDKPGNRCLVLCKITPGC